MSIARAKQASCCFPEVTTRPRLYQKIKEECGKDKVDDDGRHEVPMDPSQKRVDQKETEYRELADHSDDDERPVLGRIFSNHVIANPQQDDKTGGELGIEQVTLPESRDERADVPG